MKNKLQVLCSFMFIFSLFSPVALQVNAQETSLTIYQSVDDDLKTFNFDYKKYLVNPELVYRPIVINFNESLSDNYADLLYIYDPNDEFNLNTLSCDISYGNSENSFYLTNNDVTCNLYFAGSSNDNLIKRYVVSFPETRNDSNYRKYTINSLDNFDVNLIYLFKNSNFLEYSNSMNIKLEEAHNWSYHFDEDTSYWETFKDWLTGSDILKDQLFYSFVIPEKWDVSNIETIDIQYKKCLLEGYRSNVADDSSIHNFYKNTQDELYKPYFYSWNENNNNTYLDKTNYLGSSIYEIGNKIPYSFNKIKPTTVTSVGLQHNYTWKSIMSSSQFKNSFGKDSEIYKFASEYYGAENKNFWIINYDEFFYHYQVKSLPYYDKNKYTGDKVFFEDNLSFSAWLMDNGVTVGHDADSYIGYTRYFLNYYKFTEEYTFDISATSITYRDSKMVSRTLPVSVSPVMEKEGSPGGSEGICVIGDNCKCDFLCLLKKIIAIIGGITLFVLLILCNLIFETILSPK